MENSESINLEEQENDFVPTGRDVAENILNACNEMNNEDEQVEAPYYWEDDYPIDDPRQLSVFTILSHNLYYAYTNIVSWCVGAGQSIIDSLGWNQSNYEWIVEDMKLDKEEQEQEELQKLEQYTRILKRRQKALKDAEKDIETSH